MKHIKIISFAIIVTLALMQATKLTLQSPLKERTVINQEALKQPVALPAFQLTKNIDAQEFWAERAEGK